MLRNIWGLFVYLIRQHVFCHLLLFSLSSYLPVDIQRNSEDIQLIATRLHFQKKTIHCRKNLDITVAHLGQCSFFLTLWKCIKTIIETRVSFFLYIIYVKNMIKICQGMNFLVHKQQQYFWTSSRNVTPIIITNYNLVSQVLLISYNCSTSSPSSNNPRFSISIGDSSLISKDLVAKSYIMIQNIINHIWSVLTAGSLYHNL